MFILFYLFIYFSVLFVFTVAWIHHRSYFGITTRILHTHTHTHTHTQTHKQTNKQTNKPSASGINEAKCVPQMFSDIKNISWICKPVKCRHQTLRCILYCAFRVVYLVTCALVEYQMPFIIIFVPFRSRSDANVGVFSSVSKRRLWLLPAHSI